MNTDIGSNRLAVLASEIRQAHASAEAAAIEHATRALEAGRALIEAKSLVKHGQWLPWLREVGISSRSASRYMRLVKSGTGIGHVADLGIRATDEALAKQMPETDADELPPPEPYDFGNRINDAKFVEELYSRTSPFDLEYVRDYLKSWISCRQSR